MRSFAVNSLCVLLSAAVALAVCEAGLRLFFPRYHHAAEAHRVPDEQRIWKPPAGSHYRMRHPDTGRLHLVMHNNLGARQHRDFDQESLDGAVNLAFFGDSFAENIRLPVQYSFHAVLDFLLNASHADPDAASEHPVRFNVLNFGVNGYGPGQTYLHYRNLPPQLRPAITHVFYLFHPNDIRQVRDNGIYSLDDSGKLVERLPAKTPLWKQALARAHLTYATMDGTERLRREWFERFPRQDQTRQADSQGPRQSVHERPTAAPAIPLWRAVVMRWQEKVASGGAKFTVVDLPSNTRTPARALLPESVDVFSLRACFRDTLSDSPPTHMLRFAGDFHWNEAANMVAADCLYRLMAKRLGLRAASDETLGRQRLLYYRAFAEAPDWEGGRWLPEPPWGLPGAFSPSAGRAIVERYLALERSPARLAEHWRRVVRRAKADGFLARAEWHVYAAWDERLLVYIKEPCRDEDLRALFYLRVWPAKPAPAGWRAIVADMQTNPNTDYVDIRRFFPIRRTSDECVVGVHLPDLAFSMARTGQFVRPRAEDGVPRREDLWVVDLPLREYRD